MRFLVIGTILLVLAMQMNLSMKKRFDHPESMAFPRKEAARLAAGEFVSVASDYYLFTAAVLYSSEGKNKDVERAWSVEALRLSSYLDPYYQDVYWMAGSLLPWDGYADAALEILEKAPEYLPKKWQNFMSLGIIYYMFQKDYQKAAYYFSEASKIEGAPQYLNFLASRLYYKADEIRLAILFMRSQLAACSDPALCDKIEKRLIALESIDYLNRKIDEFAQIFGYYPETVQDLVIAGLIPFPLPEPYGGSYFITKEKKAWTTSKMR